MYAHYLVNYHVKTENGVISCNCKQNIHSLR